MPREISNKERKKRWIIFNLWDEWRWDKTTPQKPNESLIFVFIKYLWYNLQVHKRNKRTQKQEKANKNHLNI